MANNADPDQTASEEAVWSGYSLLAILTSIIVKHSHKNNILIENRTRKMFKFFEHLP